MMASRLSDICRIKMPGNRNDKGGGTGQKKHRRGKRRAASF